MIVLEQAVEDPQPYAPGLGEKLDQATEFIQADYEQTKQDLAQLQRGVKDVVSQAKETADTAGKKVSDAATNLKDRPPHEGS